jgi:cysteine synthase B
MQARDKVILDHENDSEIIKIPDIVKSIGNTPLIELPISSDRVKVFVKAEWMNPGGSVKDRAAWFMINEGLKTGELDKSKIILDATSGNTGIAMAMIGAAMDIRVKLCIPENASPERIKLMQLYGAEIVFTDPLEGMDGAIQKAKSIFDEDPDQYYYTDQYSNDANWQAHLETTSQEILSQTDNKITHFVAGLGTSGTFMGTSRGLKTKVKDVTVISVQPDSPFHGLEGLKHMETAMVPKIYDSSIVDDSIAVSTQEAYQAARDLARNGILVGISSGAAYAAVKKLADTLEEGIIVTVFPDRGDRYLSDKFWEE